MDIHSGHLFPIPIYKIMTGFGGMGRVGMGKARGKNGAMGGNGKKERWGGTGYSGYGFSCKLYVIHTL